jgi:LysR family glycine cleavage system transcriptional activator
MTAPGPRPRRARPIPYRLPPLAALRAFEAAARHLSLKRAADEIGVTPSAVSHAVASLEDWLGVALFLRGNRSIALTEAGRDYAGRIAAALADIAAAGESLPRPEGRRTVGLSVAPTFAGRWLLPNLAAFRAAHPDVHLSLDTDRRPVGFPRDGVDAAIRMGRGDWPDLYAVRLFDERLVPVGSPETAARVRSFADLCAETPIRVVTVGDDWESWCAARSFTHDDLPAGVRFDNLQFAAEAAAGGFGCAIARLPLLSAEIRAGRLVEILGPPVACGTGHFFVARPETMRRPEVRAVRDWLVRGVAAWLAAEAAAG